MADPPGIRHHKNCLNYGVVTIDCCCGLQFLDYGEK